MKNTEYSRLVDEFTHKWKTSPKEFQRSIDKFAWLGILMLVVAFVVGILLILTLKVWLVIVGGLILWSIGKAIFYRPGDMYGMPLARKDAPLLFDDVDEISKRLGASKCDGVYVDYSFNAAAIQFHQFGIVGPMRNYVLVGIPLMDGLSREHVRSTIAHEIGHLMLKHGDQTSKWYAISEMYTNIYENLSGGLAWYLFGPFTKWYLPRFHARLQPVSLRSEFEADAKEAEVTSPKTAAEALCYMQIGMERTDDAIRQHCLSATEGAAKPVDLVNSVYDSLRNWTVEEAESKLSSELLAITDVEGTHPALAERIAALGCEPVAPRPVAKSASDEYFGGRRVDIATSVVADFIASSPYYNELKERLERCKKDEQLLEECVAGERETEDDAVRYVYAKGNLQGRLAARDVSERFAQKYPENAPLQYYYGLSLLSDDDDAGIDALVKSAQLSGGKQGSIYESIYQFFLSKGRAEEAAEFRRRRDEFSDMVADIYGSRQKISKDQDYAKSTMIQEDAEFVVEVLAAAKAVQRGYLVRRIRADEDLVMHDVIVFPKKFNMVFDANNLTAEIESTLGQLGQATTVFYGPWLDKGLRDRVVQMDGALIYDRSASEP